MHSMFTIQNTSVYTFVQCVYILSVLCLFVAVYFHGYAVVLVSIHLMRFEAHERNATNTHTTHTHSAKWPKGAYKKLNPNTKSNEKHNTEIYIQKTLNFLRALSTFFAPLYWLVYWVLCCMLFFLFVRTFHSFSSPSSFYPHSLRKLISC